MSLSPRERAILEIAKDETNPERAKHYEPIAAGPLWACLAIIAWGSVAVAQGLIIFVWSGVMALWRGITAGFR